MAGLYSAASLGIKPPAGGFQQGGWYNGRQYWGGQFSDPGVINPLSNQQGAGQAVSAEVNAQSAAAQGKTPQQLEAYLQQQRDAQAKANIKPTQTVMPGNPADAALAEMGLNGGGMGAGVGTTNNVLNLPDLYKNLYTTGGLDSLEKGLADKAKAFADAQSKINDNPFLAEGNRTGRIAKLQTDYNANIKNDQDMLAMKKADIATQLDLATKQFDINSQAAKQALDQFNTLLSTGALAGASGNDIASITRATGISSGAIQAAIKAQAQKDVKTQLITSTDDNGNVTATVIDMSTGQPISKTSLGAIGNKQNSGSKAVTTTQLLPAMQQAFALSKDANGNPAVNSYGDVDPQVWKSLQAQWVGAGGSADDFVKNFSSYTDINRADFESAYGFKKSLISDVKPESL